MKIEIAGHSGCKIEIVNEKKGLFIIKSTSDPDYAPRLKNQALKQQKFQSAKNTKIKAPRILDIYSDNACCKIKMEYIYSLHFMAFIENYGFEQIDNFMESMIDFVTSEIASSDPQEMDSAVLTEKYNDVKSKILANRNLAQDDIIKGWVPVLDKIFRRDFSFQIPIGVCHGDLTLSNILFSGNGYYLIDFLDTFIETPLLDIVKLRQDTAFNWSGLMYSGSYDQVRLDIVLKLMDKKIDEAFAGYQWYRDAFGVFQLLNFLRILQYAREPRIIDFLKNTITLLLENYES